ncbi:hypothetical protein [Saccharopolyspora sp. NPDC002376]
MARSARSRQSSRNASCSGRHTSGQVIRAGPWLWIERGAVVFALDRELGLAVVDLPYAVVRRYLGRGAPIPDLEVGTVTDAVRELLAG